MSTIITPTNRSNALMATSYVTVAEADEYHRCRGNRLWDDVPTRDVGVFGRTADGTGARTDQDPYKRGDLVISNSGDYYIALTDLMHNTPLNTEGSWKQLTGCLITKPQCLIKATEHIDQRFGIRFRGCRRWDCQHTEWPRDGAIDNSGYCFKDIPEKLKRATYAYALRVAVQVSLLPDPLMQTPVQDFSAKKDDYTRDVDSDLNRRITGENFRQLTEERFHIGPLEVEEKYESERGNRREARQTSATVVDGVVVQQYPEADLWLEELLHDPNCIRLERG